MVFPFEKQLETALWKGSAAFLLDLQNTVCRECCLRVRNEEKEETWTFTLKNNICLFTYRGTAELSVPKREKLTALLRDCLESAGVISYTVCYAENIEESIPTEINFQNYLKIDYNFFLYSCEEINFIHRLCITVVRFREKHGKNEPSCSRKAAKGGE